jgi:hypothetical protein
MWDMRTRLDRQISYNIADTAPLTGLFDTFKKSVNRSMVGGNRDFRCGPEYWRLWRDPAAVGLVTILEASSEVDSLLSLTEEEWPTEERDGETVRDEGV